MLFTEIGIFVTENLNNALDKQLPRMISEELILHSDTKKGRRSVMSFHLYFLTYFLIFYSASLSYAVIGLLIM